MSWTPWQSTHVASAVPPMPMAMPWKLSMKVAIRSSGTPYLHMISGRAWQVEHVSGTRALAVALDAGRRLFGGKPRRAGALDVMDPVTVGANSRELGSAPGRRRAAMNAAAVLPIRRFGVDIVFNDDGHVLVASGAGHGDIAAVDQGVGIGGRLDDMMTMTIPAAGHLRFVPLEVGPAVDAVGVRRRAPAGTRIGGRPMA